jgi:hypothetical protein
LIDHGERAIEGWSDVELLQAVGVGHPAIALVGSVLVERNAEKLVWVERHDGDRILSGCSLSSRM